MTRVEILILLAAFGLVASVVFRHREGSRTLLVVSAVSLTLLLLLFGRELIGDLAR